MENLYTKVLKELNEDLISKNSGIVLNPWSIERDNIDKSFGEKIDIGVNVIAFIRKKTINGKDMLIVLAITPKGHHVIFVYTDKTQLYKNEKLHITGINHGPLISNPKTDTDFYQICLKGFKKILGNKSLIDNVYFIFNAHNAKYNKTTTLFDKFDKWEWGTHSKISVWGKGKKIETKTIGGAVNYQYYNIITDDNYCVMVEPKGNVLSIQDDGKFKFLGEVINLKNDDRVINVKVLSNGNSGFDKGMNFKKLSDIRTQRNKEDLNRKEEEFRSEERRKRSERNRNAANIRWRRVRERKAAEEARAKAKEQSQWELNNLPKVSNESLEILLKKALREVKIRRLNIL